jgi:acetoin utilization deacetylase AcuC-like enzyme
MNTLLLSHQDCQGHDMGPQHPESPARLHAIEKMLASTDWGNKLQFAEAPLLAVDKLLSVHPQYHIDALLELAPSEGIVSVDADTHLNPHSMSAALRAAGAALHATDEVLAGRFNNAFCAVRPPGHHAESTISMGFCLFNSVALAAERALAFGLERVAILDFDVHHGNGTVEIFQDRPEVLVCSSFQFPFYPSRFDEVVRPNICLSPLAAGSNGNTYRQAIEKQWRDALHQHQPQMIFISAGFDAHREDPLGGLMLEDSDYLWLTEFIKDASVHSAEGRIVSLLEGGYHLEALARGVQQHLKGLLA